MHSLITGKRFKHYVYDLNGKLQAKFHHYKIALSYAYYIDGILVTR